MQSVRRVGWSFAMSPLPTSTARLMLQRLEMGKQSLLGESVRVWIQMCAGGLCVCVCACVRVCVCACVRVYVCTCVRAHWRCEGSALGKNPDTASFAFHFLQRDSCRNSIRAHVLQERSIMHLWACQIKSLIYEYYTWKVWNLRYNPKYRI